MLFEHTRPQHAGYFQCDISTRRPQRNLETHGGLIYVTSGEGTWHMGSWSFPCRRGCLFAIPVDTRVSMEFVKSRPLGYYYCYFEMVEGSKESLMWPWNFGCETSTITPFVNAPFKVEIAAHFRTLQYELSLNNVLGFAAARAQLLSLGVAFARMQNAEKPLAQNTTPPSSALSKKSLPEPLAKVLDYVQERLEKDISLPDLAKVAQCSERHLTTLFKTNINTSPMTWVREQRIRVAQKMLTQGLAVKDIANRLHYSDSHHFSRSFKQSTGISPTDFIRGTAPQTASNR
jgi:AraC-like DNA-binding protein